MLRKNKVTKYIVKKYRKLAKIIKGWASPMIRFLAAKKFTFSILLLACIGLLYSILEINKDFDNTRPETSIGIYALEGETNVKTAIFNIQYDPDGSDHIGLSIWFERDPTNTTYNFRIFTSDNIKLRKKDESQSLQESIQLQYEDIENSNYWFEFIAPTSDNTYMLQEDFYGDLFGNSKSDLNLDLHINESSYTNGGPLEIYICGLSEVNIMNTYPPPTDITAYCTIYKFESISDKSLEYHGIHLAGENKNITRNKEFSLVLIGIFIGIFSSVIVEVVLDFVRAIENQ